MKRPIALGALVAAVALVVLGAGVALAAFPPTVSLTAPFEGQTWGQSPSTDLHVVGTVDTDDGEVVTKVVITADSTDAGGHHYDTPTPTTFSGDNAHESFDVQIFPDYNGKYRITAVPYGRNCSILGCGAEESGQPVARNITVAWPPETPANVKASLKDATATVVWNANSVTDEPDLLGYVVERTVGSGAFTCFKTVPLADTGPATYSVTEDLSKQPDGDYKYRVKAVRAADSTTKEPTCAKVAGVVSPASASASVKWDNPAPDPTTTTTRAGGAGGGGGGGAGGGTTTTTRRGASTGGSGRAPTRPNLSALGSLGVPTNLARPPGQRPEDDPGFNELLPFGGGEGTTAEGGVALPQSDEAAEDGGGSTTTLLFVAAGLLATVLSAHVLWLKAQVDKMPLEALVPTDVPAGGPLGG